MAASYLAIKPVIGPPAEVIILRLRCLWCVGVRRALVHILVFSLLHHAISLSLNLGTLLTPSFVGLRFFVGLPVSEFGFASSGGDALFTLEAFFFAAGDVHSASGTSITGSGTYLVLAGRDAA